MTNDFINITPEVLQAAKKNIERALKIECHVELRILL